MLTENAFDAAYKFCYSFLKLLPEQYAIPLGKGIYKRLPHILIPETEIHWPGHERKIGDVTFYNPLILGSYYTEPWMWDVAFHAGFGGVATKTVTYNARKGAAHPRVVRLGNGFVNCESYPNPGRKEMARRIKEFNEVHNGAGILIASIAGTAGEIEEIMSESEPHVKCFELNISSPNYMLTYELYRNPNKLEDLFRLMEKSSKPTVVKLARGYEEENNSFVILLGLRYGIRAYHYGNTLPVIDSRLSAGRGGYSGPDMFDDTMTNIIKMRKRFGKDIIQIAGGGIDSAERAERALEHADFLAYLSPFITKGPTLARKIKRRIIGT